MQKESLWEKDFTEERKRLNLRTKKLNESIKTDVLIIGGGIAGILCAYRLSRAGVDCVLVEKERILEGVTRNTTAKITAQHGLIYNKINKMYGREKAQQYYEIQMKALEEYRKLADKIPCDMENKTSYIYSLDDRGKLEKELKMYEILDIPYIWKEESMLPFKIAGAVGMENQAQFNPGKLLLKLAEDLKVYENTQVLEIKKNKVLTKSGEIEAKKIILATHFPMINIPGGYFAKMYQHRSYAIALRDGIQLDGMYMDEKKDGFSFRNYKNYLILGGGAHKTGTKGGGYNVLEKLAEREYSENQIQFKWSTQDCMTLDGIPYIGKHSRSRENIMVATGFNKWGMTSSMAAALVLEEMIMKGKSQYEELYSPQRSIMHPQLMINLGSAVGNILRPGRRCSHMGCALRWNIQERTWDCPCHGSKFDERGNVLENPAKTRLKK